MAKPKPKKPNQTKPNQIGLRGGVLEPSPASKAGVRWPWAAAELCVHIMFATMSVRGIGDYSVPPLPLAWMSSPLAVSPR